MTNTPATPNGRSRRRLRWLPSAVAVALVAVAAAGLSQLGSDDQDWVEIANRPAQSPGADSPSDVSDPLAREVIWPRLSGDVRFDDPVAAVRSFALDYAGFDDPTIGEFQAADSHSGEVVVQARPDGPETLVRVAVSDRDQWFVTGADAADITVDQPERTATPSCPLTTSGTALAFEGTVQVRIDAYQPDGSRVEVGRGFVTGSGAPPAGPFTDQIPCTLPSGVESTGIVLYWTDDASGHLDGPEQVVAIPIGLPQDAEAPAAPAVPGEPSFTG